MSATPADIATDAALVELALYGDDDAARNDAVTELRLQYSGPLKARLLGRGASDTDSEEILADVWSECVAGKFEHWHPQQGSKLIAWLSCVATNKFIDLVRRRKHQVDPVDRDGEDTDGFFERQGATCDPEPADAALASLLRAALERALASCDQEGLLLLKLTHLQGLTGRELAGIWGWHETKISRAAKHALEQIRESTLEYIHRREPMLVLEWSDLMELCANCHGTLFGAA